MDIKTLRAVFTGGSYCKTRPLTRQDYGIVLQFVHPDLPETYQVHFSNSKENSGTAKTQIATADGVTIPDEYLIPGKSVYAWAFVQSDGAGRSRCMVEIPVASKPTVTDAPPTPQQRSAIDEAIAALNDGVERAEGAADKAEEATEHYPRIANDYWQVWDVDTQTWQDTGEEAVGKDGAPGRDGAPGQPGRDGQDGAPGVTYTPAVSVDGEISWTNDGGLPNPQPRNIMGPTGADGAPGQPGRDGATGPAGKSAYESAQDGGYSGTEAQFESDLAGVGNKQARITASGLLKGDGAGGVSAAVAGTDYLAPAALTPYRTAAAQDVIDAAQDEEIVDVKSAVNDPITGLDSKAPVIIDTASGSIASFPDGAAGLPLKKLVVNIVSNQSGTGVPSPENIRAINGWSSATVYSSGADMSNPDDIVYSFPQAAGTVYGGTLTINEDGTGTLVVDFALHVFNGTETFHSTTYEGNPFMYSHTGGADWPFANSAEKGICSALVCTPGHFHFWSEGTCSMALSASWTYFLFKSSSIGSTEEEVNRKILELYEAGTPLVYAGPIRDTYIQTYQLTSQQVIDIVYGTNNIWADCGDVEAIYRADTKLFVEKQGGAVEDVQVNGTSVLNNGVANVPKATTSSPGVIQIVEAYGFKLNNSNLAIKKAEVSDCKIGTNAYTPIVPVQQRNSVFYGLATAAGDTTQSASNNAVGTYTDSAKSKISDMLNAPVTVSGSTPTITALAGVRYVCGEVTTLDITLPASGIVDVTFESGSTATVLTITPPTGVTVRWANGFDPTALEANTTYELNIMDGLGVAASWT